MGLVSDSMVCACERHSVTECADSCASIDVGRGSAGEAAERLSVSDGAVFCNACMAERGSSGEMPGTQDRNGRCTECRAWLLDPTIAYHLGTLLVRCDCGAELHRHVSLFHGRRHVEPIRCASCQVSHCCSACNSMRRSMRFCIAYGKIRRRASKGRVLR